MTFDWLADGSSPGEHSSRPVAAGWLDTVPPEIASELFDTQTAMIAATAESIREGVRRILLQAPTAFGKTHVIAAISGAAVAANLRVLILATRTRLVRQIHARLKQFHIRHGVIAAALRGMSDYSAPVQVASVDTLNRRTGRDDNAMPMPAADVVIFDEAHLATAPTRLRVLDAFPDAVRIGLTATPARKSGASLAVAFDRLILGPTVRELQVLGRLAPPRIFNTPIVSESELKAVPKDSANDYASGALGTLMSKPKLVGDVVQNWLRIASGRRTIVFACNKAHGEALTRDFLREGVAAELLVDKDDEAAREAAIERLEAGTTRVLVNCFLMAYGVDLPTVDCIVIARPTRSLVMFLQMVGRGARAAKEQGKLDYILIDHGRVVESLGLPTSDYPWTLEDGRNMNQVAAREFSVKANPEKMRTCPECTAVWVTSEDGSACPNCGWKPPQKAKRVEVMQADLTEIADQPPRVYAYDQDVKDFFRSALAWYARKWPQRYMETPDKARSWAWFKTRERFELTDYPPAYTKQIDPARAIPVDVNGWLQSRHIAYVKAKQGGFDARR